jgi:hypothetical protein
MGWTEVGLRKTTRAGRCVAIFGICFGLHSAPVSLSRRLATSLTRLARARRPPRCSRKRRCSGSARTFSRGTRRRVRNQHRRLPALTYPRGDAAQRSLRRARQPRLHPPMATWCTPLARSDPCQPQLRPRCATLAFLTLASPRLCPALRHSEPVHSQGLAQAPMPRPYAIAQREVRRAAQLLIS